MAQKVVDYNALAPNFSSVKDQIDMYGGGGGGSQEEIDDVKYSLAPEYDATQTYGKRSYVWHDGDLYQNSSPFEITGEWDATKWTKRTNVLKSLYLYAESGEDIAISVRRAIAPDFEEMSEDDPYPMGYHVWYQYNGYWGLYVFKASHYGEWDFDDVDAVVGFLNANL